MLQPQQSAASASALERYRLSLGVHKVNAVADHTGGLSKVGRGILLFFSAGGRGGIIVSNTHLICNNTYYSNVAS